MPEVMAFASGLRWLYVDFNSYFASVEQQLNPALRGRPVAVVPVETDATCAIAASYEAKAYGIRTGTPIYEAKRLCPGLVCVLAQHERYVTFHHRIIEEINRHIPVTSVCSIDEMACRLMRNESTPERALAIAHAIKRGLAERIGEQVRCSIGIAANPYLAKVATDLHKPDGLTVLDGDVAARLRPLRLRDLPGIGWGMERRLSRAGIFDMETLLSLDAKWMRAVWGSVWGEKVWLMLRGVEVPQEETQRRSIGHSHVMAPELRDPGKAVYVARRLALKAASRLRRLGYYAGALSLAVRLESGGRLEGMARCWRAQDSVTFLHLLEPLWQQMVAKTGKERIKKISLTLHELVAQTEVQPELFAPLSPEELRLRQKAERMSQALDAINRRFGRDTVLMGMLPSQGKSFSGTKIAFTRIPDRQEFVE